MNRSTRKLFLAALLTAGSALAAPVTMNWTIDGVERQAIVVPPPAAGVKAPVVFAFHGHGGTMRSAALTMHFQTVWPEAIVVYMQGLPTQSRIDPQGRGAGWQQRPGQNGDRDLKFFDAVLATLHQKFRVDDRRVYATGFSNGAIFSLLLWGERGKVLAAIGVCAGILDPGVHLGVPRPVIDIGGRADQIAVFAWQEATMKAERNFNGCSAKPQSCGADCYLYPSTKHAPVTNIIHDGGHVYPPWASDRIVTFFKGHPLP